MNMQGDRKGLPYTSIIRERVGETLAVSLFPLMDGNPFLQVAVETGIASL